MYILFFLVITYMTINLYTDFRKLETYNTLHFIFLVIGIGISTYNGILLHSLALALVTLAISLVREHVPIFKLSAGDSKMLTVLAFYLMNALPNAETWILAILFHLILLLVSSVILTVTMTYLLIVRVITGMKKAIKIGKFEVSFERYSTPASLQIFITILLFLNIANYI